MLYRNISTIILTLFVISSRTVDAIDGDEAVSGAGSVNGTARKFCCPQGWFGYHCLYQCHCLDGSCCKPNGACNDGCHPDWFGPSCQYASINLRDRTGYLCWLTDKNDRTCNKWRSRTVQVSLETPIPLSRLRVVVKGPDHLEEIKISYLPKSSLTEKDCPDKRRVKVNDKTLDIYCPTTEAVTDLTVSGRGVEGLCSLYVSGGRNLALKQQADQSSQYKDWGPDQAVDGSAQGIHGPHVTCSHANNRQGVSAWWWVTFSQPVNIYRIVINNRLDNNLQHRLKGFLLSVRAATCGSEIYNYSDPHHLGLNVYSIVPSPIITSPVKVLRIGSGPQGSWLTLCEVSVFGECPSGKYGFRCTEECSQTCDGPDHACDEFDGTCDSCAPGYTGVKCDQKCAGGKYGKGCTLTCNVNCGGPHNLCNAKTGNCTAGCDEGFQGSRCDQEIPMSVLAAHGGLVVAIALTAFGAAAVTIVLAWRLQALSGELSTVKAVNEINRGIQSGLESSPQQHGAAGSDRPNPL